MLAVIERGLSFWDKDAIGWEACKSAAHELRHNAEYVNELNKTFFNFLSLSTENLIILSLTLY